MKKRERKEKWILRLPVNYFQYMKMTTTKKSGHLTKIIRVL